MSKPLDEMLKSLSFTPAMVTGTDGIPNYLMLARRGSIMFAMKPQTIYHGDNSGYPGHSVFSAVVRSASVPSDFAVPPAKVVKLGPQPTFSTAWSPEIVWEKEDNTRSSTIITAVMPGTPWGSKELAQKFLDNVGDKKLATKMADYLFKLIGEHADQIIHEKDQVIEFLDTIYGHAITGAMEKVAQEALVKEAAMENVGMFTMQAALLKDAYEKTKPKPKIIKSNAAPKEDPHAADDLDPDDDSED